jgi:hypothetical protein
MGDLIETANAHIRANGEHPFRVMMRQFGFRKSRFRGMLKNSYKVNMLADFANLFIHAICCYARLDYGRRVLTRDNIARDGTSFLPKVASLIECV